MTRTALTMNGLAELRIRYARQSAKALFKPKEQNRLLIYQLNFKIVVNHDDCTNTKEIQNMKTKEARNYASKLAQLRGIDSVELYRIDKTEIFA